MLSDFMGYCEVLYILGGTQMEYPHQVRFDIDEELYKKMSKACIGINRAEFIREAIKEKISRKIKEDETLTTMVDQIKNMDPLALHGSLSDLVYTAQVIFKEVKKQNEVLKLIYESAALGGTFAYETWKSDEDEEYAEKSKVGILQSVEDELFDMKFIERKANE